MIDRTILHLGEERAGNQNKFNNMAQLFDLILNGSEASNLNHEISIPSMTHPFYTSSI